jgi:hypothetical protein
MPTPSILLIPDRYKSAVLYSQIPDSGAVDFDVTRATTAFRTNASGVLESVASGVPRLDYPALGGCPSLLVEPAATNLVARNEEFDNAYWSKQNGTVTANTEAAPDGTTTADTLTSDGGSTTANKSCVRRNSVIPVDGVYSRSIFMKKGNTRYGWLSTLGTSFVDARTFIFDFDDEVITYVEGGLQTEVIKYSNGWYRFVFISDSFTGTGISSHFTAGMTKSPTTVTDHDSGDFIHIWGAQLETGSVATSYIPTVGAAATRNADVISKTGVSGFIGQAQGTLYIDLDYTQPTIDANGRLLQIYATNDTTNSILPLILGAGANVNQFQLTTFSGGNSDIPIAASAATIVPFGQNKFAIAYNAGVYTVYRNGSLFASGTALAPASFTAIGLGSSSFAARSINNRIRAAAIYTTRLSNSELSALTTL